MPGHVVLRTGKSHRAEQIDRIRDIRDSWGQASAKRKLL